MKYRDDYEAAHVPMLPVVTSTRRTANEIFVYTVGLVGVSIVFYFVADIGVLYLAAASVLGAIFVHMSARLAVLAWSERATNKDAMRLFGYSITYLTALFVAMAADVLIRRY